MRNRINALSIVALLFCAVVSTPALAQVGAEGGSGLFFVNKARTLGNGSMAVGLFGWDSNWDRAFQEHDLDAISVPATIGLGDQFELAVQFLNQNIDPKNADSLSGFSDGLLSGKWNFWNSAKHNIRFAVIGLASLPFGDEDKGLGTGNTDVGAKLAIDKEYEEVSWHFNIGYMNRSGDLLDPQTLYGAGVEWFAFENASLIAEVSGHSWSNQIARRDDNTMVLGGARYYMGDWGSAQIGYASWGGGSGDRSPNQMLIAGITVGLGLGKPKLGVDDGAMAARTKVDDGDGAKAGAGAVDDGAGDKDGDDGAAAAGDGEVTKIVLQSVHFKFDKSDLTEKAKGILAINAQRMKENPGGSMLIEGNTCSIGADGYNYKLGLHRAKAAKGFLAKELGIDPDRMFIKSYGEKQPKYTNKTTKGRSLNRRVDFVIEVR